MGGVLKHHVHFTVGPLLLMTAMPNFIMCLWFISTRCDGSVMKFFTQHLQKSFSNTIVQVWSSVDLKNRLAMTMIICFSIFTATLQVLTPGKKVCGPVTPKGNIPIYKDNGFANYLLTMILYGVISYYVKIYHNLTPTVIYDQFGDILAMLNLFSLFLCVMIYLKGRFSPSSNDAGVTGNILFDYYWGTELYPRFFGIDVKVFTNCRFGMTLWPILVTTFALKSYELHGFVDSMWVSWFLYMVYFTKFFWWEAGYYRTLDIMMDRAGFYICWGCLVFIPGFYASVSLYLVTHPVKLGLPTAATVLLLGVISILINYWADKQKQDIRGSDGKCLIWGSKPDLIRAKYRLADGSQHESLLLVSGFWAISRHFHYVPELCLAFFWSVPALFDNALPYFYFIFLFILLVHRSFRDEEKCREKYKAYWNMYCKKVPYKILPPFF